MENKKCFFTLLFLHFILNEIQSQVFDSCVDQIFSDCNSDNKREVLFTKNKQCDTSFPSVVRNVTCDFNCESGYKYTFDIKTNSGKCEKCPVNTYSQGGNLIINGANKQWSNKFLSMKGVRSKCFVTSNGFISASKNQDCTSFMINEDNSQLISGGTNQTGVKYIAELVYGFNLKNKGSIKFHYKKDTTNELHWNNGRFFLIIDYDLVIEQLEVDSTWKSFMQILDPGFHTVVWIYDYWTETSEEFKNLKLRIEGLEIYGLDNVAYQCDLCINSTSLEGSSQCFNCEENSFFSKEIGSCIRCSDDKFSYPNSIGLESCFDRIPCDQYDFFIYPVSTCVNGMRNITYTTNPHGFCNNNHKDSIKKLVGQVVSVICNETDYITINQCEEGMFSDRSNNFTCHSCPDGKYAPNVFSIVEYMKSNFRNICVSNNREACNSVHLGGWIFHDDKIISGKYFPKDVEVTLELSKDVFVKNILGSRIEFEIGIEHLDISEKLSIYLNNILMDEYEYNSNSNKNLSQIYKKSYPLTKENSNNTVLWKYYRNKSENIENSVYIRNITIIGSTEGFRKKCENCPTGSFRNSSEVLCKKCPEGYSPNLLASECIKCPINKYSNENGECVECPTFTYLREGSCVLNDILILRNTVNKITRRLNLFPLRKKIERDCENLVASSLCYNNKFIGPYKDRKINSKSHQSDLFFFSIFEQDLIEISDFSFEKYISSISKGHIYGLFHSERFSINISSYLNYQSGVTYENVKIMKNIASSIKKVSIVEEGEKVFNIIKNGILIEYAEGDICIKDPCIYFIYNLS